MRRRRKARWKRACDCEGWETGSDAPWTLKRTRTDAGVCETSVGARGSGDEWREEG
jgi:hypothetical protein